VHSEIVNFINQKIDCNLMIYRRDIQVLRGIAVLLVVLFHLNMIGFSSGFLGVDVFFVISGYLMAMMYKHDKKVEFFIKRAKRLLPAYFFVIIATLLASIFLVAPNDYKQVTDQSFFAVSFLPNMGYWLENSYFDKETFKPLLHLWSLGVEIQFYLLVPILWWIFHKFKFSFFLLLIFSASACFFILNISTKTAFFWMPFRIWEFLLGFGVFKYFSNFKWFENKKFGWVGVVFLLGIIAIPAIKIDGAAMGFFMGHPGLTALVISVCTAATLALGIPNVLLSNPISSIFEKIGDYSYSIYLTHFHIIVLFLYKPFSGTVLRPENIQQLMVILFLIVIFSVFVFKFIEQPFRNTKKIIPVIVGSAIFVFLIVPFGFFLQNKIFQKDEMLIYKAWFDRDVYRCGMMNRILSPKAISCQITKPIDHPVHKILFVGNSHADSIKAHFSSVAQEKKISMYFMVDNSPLMNGGISPEGVIKEAKLRGADFIVMHYAPETIELKAIQSMLNEAKSSKIPLIFIMPVPVWDKNVPKMLLSLQKEKLDIFSKDFISYQEKNKKLIDFLNKSPDIKVYQTVQNFCNPKCLLISDEGKPFYYDSGHLTLTGSERLKGVFNELLSDLK
jgi:peptidoglycan/LPS O-acetylase OafA/YrhL